jgi:glutamate 5-kinase
MNKMMKQTRGQLLENAHRAVVQIGEPLLDHKPVARLRALAAEVAQLREGGVDVVLVASGAVQLGMSRLGLKRRPRQLPLLRAATAVGQVALMGTIEDALEAHGISAAQVTLAQDDLRDRARFLHQRHVLMALLDYRVVPVVLEPLSPDDSLAGAPEVLAARMPRLVEADLLVLLTAAEGLYGTSPRKGGEVIPLVQDIDDLARRVDEGLARGKVQPSVAAKVHAARLAATDGVPTVVASGARPGALGGVLHDDAAGTLLVPSRQRRSRKQWIAQDLEVSGSLRVDGRTQRALVDGGRSLLAAGVQGVEGDFTRGQAVQVLDQDGGEFARGLVGYGAVELQRIMGKAPEAIEEELGYKHYEEVIRRDDLIIL